MRQEQAEPSSVWIFMGLKEKIVSRKMKNMKIYVERGSRQHKRVRLGKIA